MLLWPAGRSTEARDGPGIHDLSCSPEFIRSESNNTHADDGAEIVLAADELDGRECRAVDEVRPM